MSRQVNGQITCLLFFLLINLYTFRKELKTKQLEMDRQTVTNIKITTKSIEIDAQY